MFPHNMAKNFRIIFNFFPHPIRSHVSGLSLRFEEGVTLKISPVTCKYMTKGHVKEGLKGLSPLGVLGACSPRKFLKLDPRKCIFQHSEVQIVYFLNQKVIKIKQGEKIIMNKDIY